MLDWIQILLVGFCTLLAFLLYRKKMYKGPPHVTGVPILGYMPFVGNEMYLTFQEIMKKRGPIFSLYLGSIYTVVLGTYDVIHEAYVTKGNVFNSRPPYLVFKIFDNETAFAVTDGEEWKVTRNFTMNALKKLGFGKTHSQSYLQAEISCLLSEIRKYEGRPLNLEHVLEHSIDSLILSIFTGLQREYNDPWQKKIIETATELMKTYVYDVMGMFPWMKKIPFLSNFTVRKKIRNNKSDEIRGFYIPKDSMIINNLYSIHHDPKYFPDPYRFYPERFLDQKGKLKPCEYVISFSIGRRTCPGRSVAEMQTFLYLTSILQAYELQAPPGSNISENNAKCDNGIIRRPASFEVLYIPRKK